MKWGHGVTSVLSLADRLLPGHEIDAGTDFLQIPCFSLTTQAPCRLASRVPPRRSWTSSNSYCASVVLARSAVLMDCALLYPGGLAAEHSTSLMAERSGSSDRNATQPTNAASMDKNRLLIELSESPRSQFGKVEYEKQSKIQRVFSAIWGLEAQVSNGGFQQYFQSSDGEAAADAADALRTIRAIRTASIVGEAVRMFPGGPPPRNLESRRQLLSSAPAGVMAAWSRLDERFVACPDNLTELLYAFVKANPEEFGPLQ
jgi:hypothetical protein